MSQFFNNHPLAATIIVLIAICAVVEIVTTICSFFSRGQDE